MLRRGQRASRTLMAGESVGAPQRITMQTLGSGGALRGVLAIGDSAELDAAGREVVTSVIALAGLALEQNRDLDRARGHLRTGLLRGILAGDTALAERVAAEMWGPLPVAPLRVAVTDAPALHVDRLIELLELRVEQRGGRLFFGRDEGTVVIVLEEADAALAEEVATEFELPVGVSYVVAADAVALAHEQALRALERARETGTGVVAFDEISRQGVLAFLARTDARAVALATLAPLAEHDAAHGTALLGTTRTWLEHGGQFDATAQALLCAPRPTVRSRVSRSASSGYSVATCLASTPGPTCGRRCSRSAEHPVHPPPFRAAEPGRTLERGREEQRCTQLSANASSSTGSRSARPTATARSSRSVGPTVVRPTSCGSTTVTRPCSTRGADLELEHEHQAH